MIENYVTYLKFINGKIDGFFEKQRPYISCAKGCGLCCQNAQFPYSEVEARYILMGAELLDDETKSIVNQNIKNVLADKGKYLGIDFRYNCPFLINDVCCVYEYRGLICRSFGLINVGDDGKMKVPFCAFQGLNYSNVMEDGGNMISEEKVKALGYEQIPSAYNVDYNFLTDDAFANGFKFRFGKKKPLIEWLMDKEF